MGKRGNLLCLVFTVCVTLATTVVLSVAVLSDYWELVKYSAEEVGRALEGSDLKAEALFDGKVLVVKSKSISQNASGSVQDVLVQMHGGLWSTCYDLTRKEPRHCRGHHYDVITYR